MSKHNPQHAFDCDNCKFNWCCGLACGCLYKRSLPEPPQAVKLLRNAALNAAGLGAPKYPDNKAYYEVTN